ncbi:MAG: methyltransferase [Hamadaea sp.]|nr:methyltransferase [Hamadaea sp.]
MTDARAAVLAVARPRPVPLLPELLLHQAAEGAKLFDGGYRSDVPPPFWAFAWPGGVALARHVLDFPEIVAGRRVVDLGSGSGVVAIAASLAGALLVRAADLDATARSAIELNAELNGARVEVVTGAEPWLDTDLVVVGDGFYTAAVAEKMTAALLKASRAGADVLVGDPGRGFLPERLFTKVAEYDVPVRPALEDVSSRTTAVWSL